jgi:D-alanyl-D-alanine carboxypeptidase (penicillin-binding protein 5/6)
MKRYLILTLAALLVFTSCTALERLTEETPVISQNEYPAVINEQTPEPTPTPTPTPFDFYGALSEDMFRSQGVYFYNLTRDRLLYSKDEHRQIPPASTLKIMTTLITLDRIDDLNALVEVPHVCFNEFYTGNPNFEGIASVKIEPLQNNLTYLDSIYGTMFASGCEISNVLAYNVGGGSMAAFIGMMNEKAAELGLVNTNFTNAHGLFEPENYTSAYDMFIITRYALEKHPLFAEMIEQRTYDMPPNAGNTGLTVSGEPGYTIGKGDFLSNSPENNPYYLGYAKAIKTGSIDYFHEIRDGKWEILSLGMTSLVSQAVINGETLIVVTLGAPFYLGPYTDEDGNRLRGLHYTYLDHMLLYETARENS